MKKFQDHPDWNDQCLIYKRGLSFLTWRHLGSKKVHINLILFYYKKKLLIVNTASKCGFTPQYTELQEIYLEYGDKLVVVGFPANEFGGQEPGSNEEIIQFCKKNFDVTFPLAEKSVVKGNGIHPLFEFLTTQENPNFTGGIKWNFEKFLIDENGLLIGRYRSSVKPDSDKIISKI